MFFSVLCNFLLSLLKFSLSSLLLVLCHLFLHLRFSVTSSLTYSGILSISLSFAVGTDVECQVACCMRVVKYFTASSNSFCSLIHISRFMFFSRHLRKLFQSVFLLVRTGLAGLLLMCELRVAMTGVWSDDSSKLGSTCM
jgi:hypothetical protein